MHAHRVGEVFPRAVDGRDVEAGVALPKTFARLLLSPLRDLVEKMVVVACIPDVNLPLPVVLKLGVMMCEVRNGHECRTISTVDRKATVVALFNTAIDQAHLSFGPERSHTGKFGWKRVAQYFFIYVFVCPNLLVVVLNMDKEMHLVFTP